MADREFDYVLVGGGLQSALLILALRALQPPAKVALIEKAGRLGGNHTWCFHQGDVDPHGRAWIEPLVTHRWSGYRVRFPGFERRIGREYSAITSGRLHEVVEAALASSPQSLLLLDTEVTSVQATSARLADGSTVKGRVVIDARGPGPLPADAGFQKFLGLEVELTRPHGYDEPVLMDATLDQEGGFRFFYVLPFSPTCLLVEDTAFSRSAVLDEQASREGILAYLRQGDLEVRRVQREERGILPMPWRERHDLPRQGPLRAGYGGGLFHPGTGYSLPVAARLAQHVASRPAEQLFGATLAKFLRAHRRQTWFCHVLNHMLFLWFPPRQRWHVFRRFYGLPLDTIERFYALELRAIDRARLVVGRPPRGMSLRHRLTGGDRT